MPETVSQDLGMHLLRFVMMAHVLPEDAVAGFLASLRAALAGFVASGFGGSGRDLFGLAGRARFIAGDLTLVP